MRVASTRGTFQAVGRCIKGREGEKALNLIQDMEIVDEPLGSAFWRLNTYLLGALGLQVCLWVVCVCIIDTVGVCVLWHYVLRRKKNGNKNKVIK